MLEARRVSKWLGGRAVVRHVDLATPPGQTTVLIGPSGCGKSTLLRLLLGLYVPEEGEVRFEGRPLVPALLRSFRRQIGYVVQGGGLFPHLPAKENVTLLARHLGTPDDRIRERLHELSTLTGLGPDVLDRYPGQLSGGQAQRVALMRALFLEPKVLLFDEPLGALDPITRYDLQKQLKDIFRLVGSAVLWVTHDLAEAAFLASTLVLMREGQIVQTGTWKELTTGPRDPFVTAFIRAHRQLPASEARA